jgi:hypothetical protein
MGGCVALPFVATIYHHIGSCKSGGGAYFTIGAGCATQLIQRSQALHLGWLSIPMWRALNAHMGSSHQESLTPTALPSLASAATHVSSRRCPSVGARTAASEGELACQRDEASKRKGPSFSRLRTRCRCLGPTLYWFGCCLGCQSSRW